METIQGKLSQTLDLNGLTERLKNYPCVLLDLGTGDGRYVRFLADRRPDWFIIGVDSCRENLHASSRLNLSNTLFVIASAQNLLHEFNGLISHVTINFPWGSLLKSLLTGDEDLMKGLAGVAKQNTQIDVLLNGGALSDASSSLDIGIQMIYDNMNRYGWNLKIPYRMDNRALQSFPTTWAKRLAHGRDPRAMVLSGIYA